MYDKTSGESMGESAKGAPATWVVRPDPDLEDLIPSFMENRKNELLDMENALGSRDFELIRRIAHTWKGISRPYGFVHLETLSKKLEASGESESHEGVGQVLAEIRDYLANVRIVYEN
jgi:HPt (histidine-containing phosphotransfer) domain-containing protein